MTGQPQALITGALGFCGRHLAACLASAGYRVSGLDRVQAPSPDGLAIYTGDIRDRAWLEGVLRDVMPTHIFHLAAITSPKVGWDALHAVNVLGTAQLLEAVRLSGLDPVVLVAGSSAVYGAVAHGELPIGEDQPFRPTTAYARSKAEQDLLAFSYHERYGLRIVRARPFNLTGPGESPGFVASSFAQQIVRIEAGQQEPVVEVGNLASVRDFVDVRDLVRAYLLLGERGRPGEVYNICSGIGTEIRHLLDLLLALSRRPGIEVRTDEARWQEADVPIQVGSAERIRLATGWRAEIPLPQTLRDVLDSWRRRIPSRSEA